MDKNQVDTFNSFKIRLKIVNRRVKQELDSLSLPETVIKWIFDYYQVDFEDGFKIFIRTYYRSKSYPEIMKKYPECCRAMEYNFRLEKIIVTEQRDDYIDRYDMIQDLDFNPEVREYIINEHRKSGYPYGLRIRRVDGGYAIFWDKIQIYGLTFQDLNLNYMKELITNGPEKTKEKMHRIFR